MITTTLPNSLTALPPTGSFFVVTTTSTGEAFPRIVEPMIVVEEMGRERAPIDANGSLERGREPGLPGYMSRWLGTLSLAFFLGAREIDAANRPTPAYCVLLQGGSLTSESAQVVAREEILAAIERFPEEDVEDGMTYELGMSVVSAVSRYHELALTTLAESILGGEIPPERASHTLRWLGRMKDAATESSRLRLLGRSLRAASPVVRDGAALGLAALGKREAIPMLRRAAQDERVASLRLDIEQVARELDQLR